MNFNLEISEIGSIIGKVIESIGVLVIVIGILFGAVYSFFYKKNKSVKSRLQNFRFDIKKGMLLGLDFLVAGDIIRTVTVEYSLTNVASLGLLVLIRTILVFTIHLEVEGHWPWQRKAGEEMEL